MDKQKALGISLSQEELFVLLGYLKTQGLLGLDMDVFRKLTRESIPMTLGVAERALIARGFLIPGKDEHFEMIDPVHAVVRSCTHPNQSVILQCNFQNEPPETCYFHLAKKMHVIHTIPMSGIHQFLAVTGLDELLKSMMSVMRLGKNSLADPVEIKIHESAFTKARNAAQKKGKAGALKILNEAGLDGNTAEALSGTLENPQLNHTVMHILHDQKGKDVIHGFGLLGSDELLWKLSPIEKGEESSLAIASISADEVLLTMKELMAG